VWLIVYYVVFMITGDLAAYIIGLLTEREFGGQVSLIVFLTLYFLFLWVSWVLAVWITKPTDRNVIALAEARHILQRAVNSLSPARTTEEREALKVLGGMQRGYFSERC